LIIRVIPRRVVGRYRRSLGGAAFSPRYVA
jgi:hypothetical protein